MVDPSFDRYYRYAELAAMLREYARAYPDLVRLESIGRSHEDREILLARVTNFHSGPDTEKPALWVDANIHAAELSGSTASLMLIHTLVHGYGADPEITRCLDSRAFYICPRVNPDGAEWALADVPKLVRSSTRPYPWPEEPRGGLKVEDVDGDGRILSMRVPDPDGPWKISEDEPRLMVPREPAETGGRYYRLLPEGVIEDYDGALMPMRPKKEQLDLNRNFPARWREEHEQQGAGPFPTSEPEVRATVEFIAAHPNICNGIAFHSYSGVLLRPYSDRPDDDMPAEDLWTYRKIGAMGTRLTGYPNVSAYHEFRYHPKETMTGAFDDWLYDYRGGFAWTVEIWSPQRQAGIGEYAYIDWYREHPFEDDVKLLRWNDEALRGQGYVEWYPFEHPQLGAVELGGWDCLYSFWNPPRHLLEKEISAFPKWLVWHNLISPKLEVQEATAAAIGDGHYRIRLVVKNSGWLPSYVTKNALNKKLSRGVIGEITLPPHAHLLQGKHRQDLGQLEGRAYKPNSPFGWAGQHVDPTDDRAKAEWLVYAPNGGTVTITARHDRAGTVRANVVLP